MLLYVRNVKFNKWKKITENKEETVHNKEIKIDIRDLCLEIK